MYLNIQGATNNFCELESLITKNNFQFVFLTETHLTDRDSNNLINLENYNIVRADTISRHTGGVLIYIKTQWSFEVVKNVSLNKELWWLVIKVTNKNIKLHLAVLYRGHSVPLNMSSNFFTHFGAYMDELSELNERVIIVGDFNINWLINDNLKNYVGEIINDSGYKQIVHEYTRITSTTKSLIDYVIVNDHYNITAKTDSNLKISDHETIKITIQENISENEDKDIRVVKYNKNLFRNKIARSDIMTMYFSNCNYKADVFSKCLKQIVNEFIIVKKLKTVNNCEWYSNNLKALKIQRDRQYRLAKISYSTVEWNLYKKLRNKYKVKINNAKNRYISSKIDGAENQKSMWKSIKTLVLKKSHNAIKEVIFNNVKYNDNLIIADKFNEYFVKSVEDINNNIPIKPYRNLIGNIPSSFNFQTISKKDLELIIKSMNNKKDLNLVNIKMFRDSFDLIGENFLSIVNSSLTTGAVPTCWKESMVVPIQKVINTKKCSEFRPVNMISIEAKILEKVVYQQLENYLETNRLISARQSGFRKGHSCESLLNLVVTNWKMAVNEGKVIVAVFLDLRRAFETVDRSILIDKLRAYGIGDIELEWFKSYLSHRKQRTRVNEQISKDIDVLLGVPQGSILGVLLFLVYINDMEKAIDIAELVLFADDALLYVIGDSIDEGVRKINSDLEKLSDWFKMNKLMLNIDKSKCMIVNSKLSRNIYIDNAVLEEVAEIKYLGVIIDKNLNFKSHINYICKKISKKLYFFSKIRKKLSTLSAIRIYNTMIKPHFEYCSSILFMSNNEMTNRLQKLQNKGMRTILKVNRYTSRRLMLSTLKWISVYQRINMNVLILVFKIKNKMLPSYLTEKLIYVGDVQKHFLRNNFNFRLNYFRSEKTCNMLMHNGLKLFNELPNNLKLESNFKKFKKNLVQFVKQRFNSNI